MKQLKKLRGLLVVIMIVFLFSACGSNNTSLPSPSPTPEQQQDTGTASDNTNKQDVEKDNMGKDAQNTEKDHEDDKELPSQPEPIDYEKVKPNELGEVMILMYHYFGETEKDVWWRSFENFKKDLNLLYERGYRLISMDDFLANNIDIPAGTTPVIFTFDDGHASQFSLIEEEDQLVVNPNSAVGIMKQFSEEHPDFGLEGTFYVNEVAFSGSQGTEKERMKYLLDLGMDIGNHTFGHTNLGQADAETIQKVIGQHVQRMQQYFPNYQHNTLALPFGSYSSKTHDYIIEGKYKDTEYKNDVVLAVGSNPTPAPMHKKFNTRYMPRVRASDSNLKELDMYYYLDYFEKNPHKRYVSDGDKTTICFSEEDKENLDEQKVDNKKVVTY